MLSFDYARDRLDSDSDYVTLEISGDGGGTWTELDRFAGPATDTAAQSVTYDISDHATSNHTVIRFLSSPSLGSSDSVFIDSVAIGGNDQVHGGHGPAGGGPKISRPGTGGGEGGRGDGYRLPEDEDHQVQEEGHQKGSTEHAAFGRFPFPSCLMVFR